MVNDLERNIAMMLEHLGIKNPDSSLVDPYEVEEDTWNLCLDSNSYSTYIKHPVWVSDGETVEVCRAYKVTPGELYMESGTPTHWMTASQFPIDENRPPAPPIKKDKDE